MSDKFDEQAEALLPCECDGFLYVDGVAMKAHTILCPAYYRLIVAAALRANGQRLQETELKFLDLSYEFQAVKSRLTQAQAEIERLGQFILHEIPGEPSQSEGAVDTSIRLIRALRTKLVEARKILMAVEDLHELDELSRLVHDWLAANRERK